MDEERKIVDRVEETIDEHTAPPRGERKYGSGADAASLRREQQDEMAQSWGGPGMPTMTDAQWKGLVGGSLLGGLVGALAFLPLALIPFGGADAWLRILVVAIAGALAGGTAAALYLGGREPELEGETLDADGRPSVGTTMRDPHTDAHGR